MKRTHSYSGVTGQALDAGLPVTGISRGKMEISRHRFLLLTFHRLDSLSDLHTPKGPRMKRHVPGMSCDHCVAMTEKAVKSGEPTAILRTDLEMRPAEIDTAVSSDALTPILAAAGYSSTALEDSL